MAKTPSLKEAIDFSWKDAVSNKKKLSDCHITVIGAGTTGRNVINRLMETDASGSEFITISTDAKQLITARAHQKILVKRKRTKLALRGIEASNILKNEARAQIATLLSDVDLAVIVGGLHRGTEPSLAMAIAEATREKGAITIGIIELPVRYESGRNEEVTEKLAQIRSLCDSVMLIDNREVIHQLPHMPLSDTREVADQISANVTEELLRNISSPDMANVDFADFKSRIALNGISINGLTARDKSPNGLDEILRRTPRKGYTATKTADQNQSILMAKNPSTDITSTRFNGTELEFFSPSRLAFSGSKLDLAGIGASEVTLITTSLNPRSEANNDSRKWAPQLFNMDPSTETQIPLNVELNLYQMEKS